PDACLLRRSGRNDAPSHMTQPSMRALRYGPRAMSTTAKAYLPAALLSVLGCLPALRGGVCRPAPRGLDVLTAGDGTAHRGHRGGVGGHRRPGGVRGIGQRGVGVDAESGADLDGVLVGAEVVEDPVVGPLLPLDEGLEPSVGPLSGAV